MSPLSQKGYERALSNILTIRHLSSFTEADYIMELGTALSSCSYLEKTACPQIFESEFPFVSKWCLNVLSVPEIYDEHIESSSEIAGYMQRKKLKTLLDRAGLKAINKDLEKCEFLSGNMPSNLDKAVALLLQDKYLLSLKSIVRFLNSMHQMNTHLKIAQKQSEKGEVKLHYVRSINKHNQMLSREYALLENDNRPLSFNTEIFDGLDYNFCVHYSHIPIVLTIEQLVVFEGPKKQLIIGSPRSGKTELLKAKAKQLAVKIKASGEDTKILYIVSSSGSMTENPLLGHQMKRFFAKFRPVEVHTVTVDEQHAEMFEKKTSSGQYGHVFIDEYWIGSTPAQHSMFLNFITNIPGYVWISSVNNFKAELLDTSKDMALCTKPLVEAIREERGTINYLTQIVRGTNNIICLEREYTALYQDRAYPYGTEMMLGHSVEGFPIAWKCVANISEMYTECIETIKREQAGSVAPDGCAFIKKQSLSLADILVVDFAIRIQKEEPVFEERLVDGGISVWSKDDNMDNFMNRKAGKITLLRSKTRNDSTFIDGVEWPMVIVILAFFNNDKKLLMEGADILMNYDVYLSFFRAQAKLVIISDKWQCNEDFIEDVKKKPKRRLTGDVY